MGGLPGEKKAFDAYNIEGSNYFKLRDLAYVLNGTDKQFEVGWDAAANAISPCFLPLFRGVPGRGIDTDRLRLSVPAHAEVEGLAQIA